MDKPPVPIAWKFELARARQWEGGVPVGYGDWSPPQVSLTKPCVPEGSIRNLTPLVPELWGLRVHPKFSLHFVGTDIHGDPNWETIYAHSEWSLVAIYRQLNAEQIRHAMFQKWEADKAERGSNNSGWVDYTPEDL
jgi:hypothetical protein